MISLNAQAVRDIAKAQAALDASEVIIDQDRDTAFLWSPDRGAAFSVKLWSKNRDGSVPSDVLDKTLGQPETLHESEQLAHAKAAVIVAGNQLSPVVRAALADLAERRRLAAIHGNKDKSIELEIADGYLRLGNFKIEGTNRGTGATVINGGYLQAAFDHCWGMQALGVQLELHAEGVVRVLMQSPNQQTEPDTRWRGQAVLAPIIVRNRQVGKDPAAAV